MKVIETKELPTPSFQPKAITFICESEKELEALSCLFNHCWILDAVAKATGVDLFELRVWEQLNEITKVRNHEFYEIVKNIFRSRL